VVTVSRRTFILGIACAPLLLRVSRVTAAPSGEAAVAFRVRIPDVKVEHILSQVRAAHLPENIGDPTSWQFGMSYSAMREIVHYWTTSYDWRKSETELNRYPQFLARIEDFQIHFYHVRGEGSRPVPLILTHGWPGSVYEFHSAIPLLTRQGFTVVVPSLPGFGFSSKPIAKPVGPVTTARLWHKLMIEVLGYGHYGIQGGDLGCIVSTHLAFQHPENAIGLHLNLVPPPGKPDSELSAEERDWLKASQEFRARELDYFEEQAHKPATVSLALSDNPVGTAAWILEKLKIWSDSGDSFEPTFSKDDLLTDVMIYLVSDSIGSSVWFYRGVLDETGGKTFPGKVTVPTAVADFPKDLLNGRPPKSLIEYGYNLVRYTKMPRGGHFAAFEQPELFSADVAGFFHSL
jgi:pimeloyl-ACP methyl ester carboxylesterase